MALLYIDGFDNRDAHLRWTGDSSNWNYNRTTRLGSGYALSVQGAGANAQRVFAAASTVYAGFAFYVTGTLSATIASFYGDAGTTEHIRISVIATGAITIGRVGTVLATSAAGVIQLNTWNYLEMSGTIADAGGAAEVKLNGVSVVTASGDTKNAGTASTISALGLANSSSGYTSVDDLYICDSTGATHNTYLGDVRVQTIRPNGAGSQTQLSSSSGGANYTNVDENPTSTVDYNYSVTPGDRDLYAMEDIVAGTSSVLAVQAVVAVHKTDSGIRSAKVVTKVGATVTTSSAAALSTSQTAQTLLHATNPSTATAWAVGDIAGLEVGAEVA